MHVSMMRSRLEVVLVQKMKKVHLLIRSNTQLKIKDSYVRGDIEFLHEELVLRVLDIEDEYTDVRIGNFVALMNNPFIPEI